MAFGPIIAVRVFKALKTLKLYASGAIQRGWFAEQFSTEKMPELTTMTDNMDRQAAVDQTTQIRLEHTDIFCIQRDAFYGSRSRKWLYTRAVAGKLEQNYGAWLGFVRENLELDLNQFVSTDPDVVSTDPDELMDETPADLLEIDDPV